MSQSLCQLSDLVRSSAEDLILLGYVRGIQSKLPGVSREDCFRAFRREFNVTDDDVSDVALRKRYERMQERYYDHLKTDSNG